MHCTKNIFVFCNTGDTDTGAQCELELVLSFPRLVLVALCAAKDYLAQFNVESVLKVASTFKVLAVMQEMQLSGNALVQLEILQNSLDGGRQVWAGTATDTK